MLLVILCSVASGIAGIGVGFLIHLRTLVRESVTKRASDSLVNELTNVLSQMTARIASDVREHGHSVSAADCAMSSHARLAPEDLGAIIRQLASANEHIQRKLTQAETNSQRSRSSWNCVLPNALTTLHHAAKSTCV